MTAKEQKIKDAWIAEIGEKQYNDVKEHIGDNGIFYAADTSKVSEELYDSMTPFFDNMDDLGDYDFVPKSLRNIENNNGWNRIDEVGLPSEDGRYILGSFDSIGIFNIRVSDVSLETCLSLIEYESRTHWRKKEQLPNPVY